MPDLAHASSATADLEETDGDFDFRKERQRDPFHGRSVRLRGSSGCGWQMNELLSCNPELTATNRSVKTIHSSTSSATYAPVTAVDMCMAVPGSSSRFGGIVSYGREQGTVLGRRGAWDQVVDSLEENAARVCSDKFNKFRLTKDMLFDVPIIGHIISTEDSDVQQSLHWPILNGKAYDPARLYVKHDASLVPFGCGERHPLPLVAAQCSAASSCNLCDDLAQAFADDGAARKSMPLLPVPTWGCKLWLAVDGRAIDRRNRSPWNSFASFMHDRCSYMPWSQHACRARPGQCVHTAISRHAVEVFMELPKPQAVTHIGVLGQQAEVEFMEVNGCSSNINRRWRRGRGMRNSSLLKTVVDPESLGWVTSFTLYCYSDAGAKWTCLGSFKANSNSFEEQLIDLKPHFNSAEALVTQRLKIVPTSSHGVFPRMRISVYNGVQQHIAPSSTITYRLSSLPSRPACERASYGDLWHNRECRFCWGSRRWCNCKKLQKRQEWSAEVWTGCGWGFGKGESAAIEEALSDDYFDYDYENDHYRYHDGENTADADVGNCVAADADSFAGEDVTAAGEFDDEDTGSWVSLDWEDVDADGICAESCCCSSSISCSSSSSISCSSSSSSSSDSSESELGDISSCDDTCSSNSDASIISASSVGSRRRM